MNINNILISDEHFATIKNTKTNEVIEINIPDDVELQEDWDIIKSINEDVDWNQEWEVLALCSG